MDLEWTVVIPGSEQSAATPSRGDAAAFGQALDRLLKNEEGYMEVATDGSAFPMLALSKRGNLGVVHRFDDADTCLLLRGDGQVPSRDAREFRVQDVLTDFTGDFISAAGRAGDVLRSFADGSDVAGRVQWTRL